MKKTNHISVLLTLFATSLFAQTPTLVQDLNTGSADGFDQWNNAAFKLGNDFFIAADNGTDGLEPYVLKNGNLLLLKDIAAGSESSDPTEFVAYNNKVYFTAFNSDLGGAIWSTDGTPTGTSMVIDPSADNSLERPKGLIVAKNGALYFSYQGKLHKSFGDNTTTEIVPGGESVGFVEDFSSTGLNYATYENGVAYLSKSGQNLKLWAAEDSIVFLGQVSSTSFTYDYFGLSQVKKGLVFAAKSSFDTQLKGLYHFNPDDGTIAKLPVNGVIDATINRTMPVNDDRIVVLEQNEGFISIDGTGTDDQVISSYHPNFLTQGTPLLYTIASNHLVFLENEEGADQRILSTDGTTAGTSLIAQPTNDFASNFITHGDYAIWATGISNLFTPQIWYASPNSGNSEMYYEFQQNSVNIKSVILVGVQDEKLYYLSNLDDEVGRELYYLPFNISSAHEYKDMLDLKVYNIGKEVFVSSNNDSTPIEVAVYDQLGRLVTRKNTSTNTSFSIEHRNGFMFIEVKGANYRSVNKIFIGQ